MTSNKPDVPPQLTVAGQKIEKLPLQHGVNYVRTRGDESAEAVTRLFGDDFSNDATEELLIALRRRYIIDNEALRTLLGEHLHEKFGTR